ncbi:MAG: class I SAM-dependent methyltransferase [Helicobacteraceae bacterium]|jgi:predicted TPR repeat methyltransferase|nr:class I SAM-dependent methyltransferase [Helicobacteraceae bacterium]
MNNALDMYARFEPLIPFAKEIDNLHSRFLSKLQTLNAKSVLDVGCGSGAFLSRLQSAKIAAKGVDLSAAMVQITKSKGLNAEQIDLKDEIGFYDALSAIFDVVNYINDETLIDFFRAARDRLNPNGAFVFDVNSLYGFKTAEGDLILENADRFAAVSADFDGKTLLSRFTLFDRKNDDYKRSDWRVTQYYHSPKTIANALNKAGFKSVEIEEIYLYGGAKADKLLFCAKI